MYVIRHRGVTLIEIVIVMTIIAISLTLVGPRIGAGIGRLELNQAAQTVRGFVKLARMQAERGDRPVYVVLDKRRNLVSLLSQDMKVMREREIPRSVQFVFDGDFETTALHVPPSGILRQQSVRLRGRVGEIEVRLR